MSWKIRTDALVTRFSSFHNLGKVDRTLAVVSEGAPMGKQESVLNKLRYNSNSYMGELADCYWRLPVSTRCKEHFLSFPRRQVNIKVEIGQS